MTHSRLPPAPPRASPRPANYGQSIVEVSEAVRRNVIERIESMTGLEVTEVNIMVDDLFVEGEGEPAETRVQ